MSSTKNMGSLHGGGMVYNGLNMVRLAFWNASFSSYDYFYLLLSSSYLALSAKCTIFFVRQRFVYLVICLSIIFGSSCAWKVAETKNRIIKKATDFMDFVFQYWDTNVSYLVVSSIMKKRLSKKSISLSFRPQWRNLRCW